MLVLSYIFHPICYFHIWDNLKASQMMCVCSQMWGVLSSELQTSSNPPNMSLKEVSSSSGCQSQSLGVRLDDPSGYLPIQGILWFYKVTAVDRSPESDFSYLIFYISLLQSDLLPKRNHEILYDILKLSIAVNLSSRVCWGTWFFHKAVWPLN